MKNLKQLIDEVVESTVAEWTANPMTPNDLYNSIETKMKERGFTVDEHVVLSTATYVLQIIWF